MTLSNNLKHVYVSSARRGFLAIVDRPFCIDSPSGSSGNHLLLSVKRVVRREGGWHEAEPDAPAQIWMQTAWEGALALLGSEPWRVYELDADEVARLLDEGRFTDDIRGFTNRLEPWQPKAGDGGREDFVDPKAATAWERDDGWRVKLDAGTWFPDGSRCNADESILEYSANHFLEIPRDTRFPEAEAAMAEVDRVRPWA